MTNGLKGFWHRLRVRLAIEQAKQASVRPAPAEPTRIQTLVWIVLLVCSVILALRIYGSFQIGTDVDDSEYIILSRSLVQSAQYGFINPPGVYGEKKYPFGYPLILAPFSILFPGNLDVLQIPSLLATIVNSGLVFWGWRWFSRKRSHWWGIALAGLYGLSPLTLDHTRRVMSEPVFTTFCLSAILLAEIYVQGQQRRWLSFGLSVSLLAVTFTRTIGIVLVASIIIYLVARKGIGSWKEITWILVQSGFLLSLIVVATPLRPADILPLGYLDDPNARVLVPQNNTSTSANVASPSQPQTFEPNVTAWIRRADYVRGLFIFGMKQHLGSDIRAIVLPIGGGDRELEWVTRFSLPYLPIVVGFLVSGLVIAGMVRLCLKDGLSQFLLFPIFYFPALFLWIWNDARLLYPIQFQINFAFLAAVEGLLLLPAVLQRQGWLAHIRKAVLPGLVIVLMALSVSKSLQMDDSRVHAGDVAGRSAWLRLNTAESTIIMTEAPGPDYLYSLRKTVPYPPSLALQELDGYLVRQNVNYILVAPQIKWQTAYRPEYSSATKRILSFLIQLDSVNRVKLVYSSDRDLIQVFQVQP